YKPIKVIRPLLQPDLALVLVPVQVIGSLNPLAGVTEHCLGHLAGTTQAGQSGPDRAPQVMRRPVLNCRQPPLLGPIDTAVLHLLRVFQLPLGLTQRFLLDWPT